MTKVYTQPLQERTLHFSKLVIQYCRKQKITLYNKNIIDQVLRSATSIGANYLEANNGLSYKDFIHRLRIVRKESNETKYWLHLLQLFDPQGEMLLYLIEESNSLLKIFSAIIRNKKKITDEF